MAELSTHQRAIVYESGHDFSDLSVTGSTEPECKLFPSQKIDPEKLKHLAPQQRKELLEVLDNFSECFSDQTGRCDWIQHERILNQNGYGLIGSRKV